MRKRRRQRNIWLPVIGSTQFSEQPSNTWASDEYGSFGVDATTGNFEVNGEIVPLTSDHNLRPDETTQDTTLSEILGNEYILRRIVGNLQVAHWTGVSGTLSGTYPANAQVVAGFFVARTDEARQDDSRPQGYDSTLPLSDPRNLLYNPLSPMNMRNPWIWRRRWILGIKDSRGGTPVEANIAVNLAPPYFGTTQLYGSMREGGYIDAKTVRRVRTDERLFFVIGAQFWTGGFNAVPTPSHNSAISWSLDYRLLGGLRRARQRGAF